MNKLQIVRIFLSSVFTVVFFKAATSMISLSKYVIARMLLDTQLYDINILEGVDTTLLVFVYMWYICVYLTIVFVVWRFFAIPEKLGFIDWIKKVFSYIGLEVVEIDEDEIGK